MRNLILGTAGHIDHGKTALVRALTGVDTDRLAEEKARGITIDLGFAELEQEGVRFGIVDVPGHEGFIRNMVAGATGMDVVLLVVSAEEGVMPQTREHHSIVDLLGVRSLVVALTKADLVGEEWLALVREDVRDFLAGGPYVDAPILATSAETGAGLEELRTQLVRAASRGGREDADDLTFLPVDRVFTVRGTGTVATGTLWSGTLAVGDRVRVLPDGIEGRVRGLQRHGEEAEVAGPGSRTAVALTGDGVDTDALRRGQAVVTLPEWDASRMLTVRVRVLEGTGWELEQGQRVRLHLGTAEVMARCVLLGGHHLGEGDEGWAQLRLEAPVAARARQRFVLRSYSPMLTMAGGVVAEPHPPKRRPSSGPPVDRLRALLSGTPAEAVEAGMELAGDAGVPARLLPVATGLAPPVAEAAAEGLRSAGAVLADGRWVAPGSARRLQERILDRVDETHRREPYREGVPLEQLRALAPGGSPRGLVDAMVDRLVHDEVLVAARGVARRSEFSPSLSPEQAATRSALRSLYREAGLQPPLVQDLPEELRRDPAFETLMKGLEREEELVALDADFYIWGPALRDAVRSTVEALAGREGLGPADFKEVLPVSRRYLLPILRYFDGTGVTRNNGDVRAVLPPSA